MRIRTRAIARLALALVSAVGVATCAEAPTGPARDGGIAARLAFAPRFSASAMEAAAALRVAGLEVRSIRIVIRRPGTSDVLLDSTIAIAPGSPSVTIEANIQLRGAEELLEATLDFRDASGNVLYSGVQRFVARPGTNEASALDSAIVEYVGPGAAATQLRLTPADTSISGASPLPLVAKATDAAGTAIATPLLIWTSSDPTLATVSATGVVTPTGPRGAVQVTARIPTGLAATATVRIVPPAARLVVIGGSAQAGPAGGTLAQPFTVEVQAADGLPSAGETVTFIAVTAGGAVTTATATSDAQGRASTPVVLGPTVGGYEYRAVSGSLAPVSIAATAFSGPAARILRISGDGQGGTAGTVLPLHLVVRATDAFGNPVAGATVAWTSSGSGSAAPATSVTDAEGHATTSFTLGAAAGTESVRATLAASESPFVEFTLTSVLPEPRRLVIAQQPPATARSGIALGTPVRVQLADAAEAPLARAGRVVTASVLPPHTLTGTTTAISDSTGVATFPDLVVTGLQGPVTLSLASGALPVVSSNAIELTAGNAATLAIRPAAPTTSFVVVAGQTIAEGVWLETADASGNRVPGEPVRFVTRSGGPEGTIVGDSTLASSASGEVGSPRFPVPASAGTYHVTATIGAAGAAPVTFALQVNPSTIGATVAPVGATTIPINVGPVAIGSRSVVVRDAQGAALPGIAVTYTLPGAGANGSFTGERFEVASVTDAGGVASFPAGVMWTPPEAQGSYAMTVVARAGEVQVGSSVTFTAVRSQWSYRITATPAAPAPSTAVALSAQLVDGSGASLGVSPARNVTWSVAVGTGTAVDFATTALTGDGSTTASLTTDAAPGAAHTIRVTDTGFAITGTMTVTTTGLSGPSAIVYGSAGPVASGDLQVAPIGGTLAQPLLVRVLDGNGSPMPNVEVEWRRRWDLSSVVTVDTTTTDASGIASLTPTLPVEDPYRGHIFEASPVAAPALVMRFRAAARSAGEDAVWFGPTVGDGAGPQGYAGWSTASNWWGGVVPSGASNVLLPAWENYWVASPQLTGNVAVNSIAAGTGFTFPYLDVGTHELSVGGTLRGSLVAGTGTIRMTGTNGSVEVHAAEATLVVPAGASVAMGAFTTARHVMVGGTLQVGEQSLQLTGGDLTVTGQLLMNGGSVSGGANVIFDNTTFDAGNSGSMMFGQLFEQRGATALALPEFFVLYPDLSAGGTTATIRFANPASSIGTLSMAGPASGTPSTLAIDGTAQVTGELVVTGLVNVTGTMLRLHADNVVLPATADLSGLATLESHGYYVPILRGALPPMTEIWASELIEPSTFNNLRVHEAVQPYWFPLVVNGNLEVLGPNGQLRMMNERDTIVVKGTATFAGDSAAYLRRGVLRIGGDLLQRAGGGSEFRPDTGSLAMTVIFDGTVPQKVDFESPTQDAGGSYLGNVIVAPGSRVEQASAMTIGGKAQVLGTWVASLPLLARHIDVQGGQAPGRLETHAGTDITRLDMQSGSQWLNAANSALGLAGANFYQGAQIWNYAGDALFAEACYNAGYVMMDNTQVFFSCTLNYPIGYAASLAPMGTTLAPATPPTRRER